MTERSRLGRDPFRDGPMAAPAAPDAQPARDAGSSPAQAVPGNDPVSQFFTDCLESVLPAPCPAITVRVPPAARLLPAPRLFAFGQALQLLLLPLRLEPDAKDRQQPAVSDAAGAVTLELRCRGDACTLRLFDDGQFFSRYFPDCSLEWAAFSPLRRFLEKNGRSLLLKQGRCTEFEMTLAFPEAAAS